MLLYSICLNSVRSYFVSFHERINLWFSLIVMSLSGFSFNLPSVNKWKILVSSLFS